MPAAACAAALYSLIESAKLNGLNPQYYLADVLARIADHPARPSPNSCPGTGNRSTPLAPPPEPARSPNAYPAAWQSVHCNRHERRQQGVAFREGADPGQPQLLDQPIQQRLVRPLHPALGLA